MIPMSRSEVDALKKDECLQLMGLVGEAQSCRGVLVVELKAVVEDLLFSNGEPEKPLLGVAKMNKSQLADKARQLQIPVSENHTRRHLIKIIREDLMQQSTPKGSNNLGFGKHGTKTYQEVPKVIPRILPLDRSSGGSAIPRETQEVLFVAEDAERLPGTDSGKE